MFDNIKRPELQFKYSLCDMYMLVVREVIETTEYIFQITNSPKASCLNCHFKANVEFHTNTRTAHRLW